MLNTLKDIFQPTRKKILWTIVVTISLTVIGGLLAVFSVHGPDAFFIAGAALMPLAFLLGKFMEYFGLDWEFAATVLYPLLQLVHYYIVVSIIVYIKERRKANG